MRSLIKITMMMFRWVKPTRGKISKIEERTQALVHTSDDQPLGVHPRRLLPLTYPLDFDVTAQDGGCQHPKGGCEFVCCLRPCCLLVVNL